MKDDSFRDFVLEQLREVGGVECRAMFGGHGLYHRETFFGIIHKGRFYLRVSDQTRGSFESAGSEPFRPGKKQVLQTYYEVPAGVLESASQLGEWTGRSIAAAQGAARARVVRRNRKAR
jgi:DNA transformation protein